ncbi:HNH endonuclease signature motif containing protein [Paenibacillus tianjinensis]|uniref:HNH endonuclease n=1 Tax=Paenibacillus tianjinensis TaxID=2810347 RepID=A0ABX7L611_9BACL|nr:HNH endonuclease signature motif containing protein [Paenibacillus tianjinensis]QSF43557.1 HNH endonuclease [Paenibacillus tianjinensis]
MGKRKYNLELARQIFNECGYVLTSDKYINSNTPLSYVCSNGHEGRVAIGNFVLGRRCSKCKYIESSKKQRLSFQTVKENIESMKFVLLSEEYLNNHQKLHVICHCGNKTQMSYKNIMKGHSCTKCRSKIASNSRRLKYTEVQKTFVLNNCLLLSEASDYKSQDTKLKYRCACGNIAFSSLVKIRAGVKCKKCSRIRISNTLREKHKNNPFKINKKRTFNLHDREWRRNVLEKDEHKCIACGSETELQAHHMDSYHWCVKRRTDVNNGATLCRQCHADFHNEYTRIHNTEAQFKEWLRKQIGGELIA